MKRLASVVLVVTASIVTPLSATAADGSAQFAVMPPGTVSCASWTTGRDETGRGYTVLLTQEGVMRSEREGWVAGYISALNVEILPNNRGATRDLTEGLARDEIMTAIDNYCAENPLHSLLSATASVSLELANAWLAAHPAGAAPDGVGVTPPIASLPPPPQPAPDPPDVPPPAVAPPPAPIPATPLPTPSAVAVSEAPPAELRGTGSVPAGAVLLQVGAFPSEALAGEAWQAFRSEHPEIVADLTNNIQEVDLGARGVWYRLRIGPFADRAAANARCAELISRGVDCFVVVP